MEAAAHNAPKKKWLEPITALIMALATVVGAMVLRSLSRLVAASKKVGAASPMMREPALPLTHPFAGLFCWEPDLRAVAIKSGPAYRINLAEVRTYLYAAYLAGFALFGVWSRLG